MLSAKEDACCSKFKVRAKRSAATVEISIVSKELLEDIYAVVMSSWYIECCSDYTSVPTPPTYFRAIAKTLLVTASMC